MHLFSLLLLLLAAPALAQQAPAPAMRGDAITVSPAGATSARLLPEMLAAQAIDVRAFGAVCNGSTDDAAAIQAAINAAGSYTVGGRTIRGGRVYIPPTTNGCAIGSTLVMGNGTASPSSHTISTQNSVTLVGEAQPFSRLQLPNSLGLVATQLRWIGAAGGTMIRLDGPTSGHSIRNVALDAATTAATCLEIISARNGEFSGVSCARFTGTGLRLTTRPTNNLQGNDTGQLSAVQLRFEAYQSHASVGGTTAIDLDGHVNAIRFTAGASGTTLTVTAVDAGSGTLQVGSRVFGGGLPADARIAALGTGTGGIGTYTLDVPSVDIVGGTMRGAYSLMDSTRVAFYDTFIAMPSAGGGTGIRLAFVDQVGFHNTLISTSNAVDGTVCGVEIVPRTLPSAFPQNIIFTGYTDLGQNLRQCAGAEDIVIYSGGQLRFENLTTFDRQILPTDPFTQFASGTYTDQQGWRHEFGQRVQDRAFRNHIANPRFARASRGTSFNNTLTGTSTGAVTIDGLYFWTDGTLGAGWSLQRLQTNGAGEVDIPFNNTLAQPYNPRHYIKLTLGHVTGATFTRLGWRIPDVRTLAGRTVTLSANVVGGGGRPTIFARFEQNFGTGGSPSTQVVTNSAPLTTVVAHRRLQWTVTLPSISSLAVLGTDGNDFLGVYLGLPFNDSVTNLYLADVQLEAGQTASAFEMRPEWVDEALSARVLQPWGGGMTGQAMNTTDVCLVARLASPMVRAPSVSLRPGVGVTILESITSRTAASPSITAGCSGSTPNSVAFSINGFTSLTATRGVMTLPMATAPFLLSAEP